MRSFISLNINDGTKEEIKKIQNLLEERIISAENVRFENPKNFHITLFFIGEVSEKSLINIHSDLKHAVENKYDKMSFICSGINAFPSLKKPKVLFLNCRSTENKINELADSVAKVLGGFNIKRDKDFHPHITLARVKGKIKLKDLSGLNNNVSFSVSKLSIMMSTITTKGAEHTEIFAINL